MYRVVPYRLWISCGDSAGPRPCASDRFTRIWHDQLRHSARSTAVTERPSLGNPTGSGNAPNADSVAASDHDRRPYVVYRTAYSGSTLARCNPRAGGAGLQYRVAVIISFDNDPSATESEHSFATDLLYFLAARVSLCPVRPVLPGGAARPAGTRTRTPPGDISAGDGLPPVWDSSRTP